MPGWICALLVSAACATAGYCASQSVVQVVDAGSGRVLPGAVVHLANGEGQWEFETGSNGAAVLAGVSPGDYRIRIEKEWYVDPLDLEAEGRPQNIPGPDRGHLTLIALVRTVTISGEITGSDGRPLGGMSVLAVRRTEEGGRIGFSAVGLPAYTDDLGRFRLYRLPPGAYTVTAVPAATTAKSRVPGVVYFPGKRDISQADFLESQGGELGPIRIQAPPLLAGSIVGGVSGIPHDWPAPVAAVALIPLTGIHTPIAAALTDRSGRFSFESIPTGEYHLLSWGPVSGADLSAKPGVDAARFAAERLTVTEGGAIEAHLSLAPAIHLDINLPATACTGTGRLEASVDPWPTSWVYEGRQHSDGFALKGLPPGELRAAMPALDVACIFQGLKHPDRDSTPARLLRITAPGRLTASVIAGTSTVVGAVKFEGLSARVLHLGLWNLREQRFGGEARTAEDGSFRFERVPPGTYRVIPLTQQTPLNWRSSVFVVVEGQTIQTEITVTGDR
jgi:hypothetical protein